MLRIFRAAPPHSPRSATSRLRSGFRFRLHLVDKKKTTPCGAASFYLCGLGE